MLLPLDMYTPAPPQFEKFPTKSMNSLELIAPDSALLETLLRINTFCMINREI